MSTDHSLVHEAPLYHNDLATIAAGTGGGVVLAQVAVLQSFGNIVSVVLSAFISITVAKLYKLHAANQGFRLYRRALLMENKWRAARYGLQGKLIDFGKRTEVPLMDLMHEYLAFVDDVVDELGSRQEINYIHRILREGSGADRQLNVFRETGDLKRVVDYIMEETEVGIHSSEASA